MTIREKECWGLEIDGNEYSFVVDRVFEVDESYYEVDVTCYAISYRGGICLYECGQPYIFDGVDFENRAKLIYSIDYITCSVKIKSGMNCIKCNSYNEYAEPNQKDNTYKCYSCRL
jgi:hypothetical protein